MDLTLLKLFDSVLDSVHSLDILCYDAVAACLLCRAFSIPVALFNGEKCCCC